MHIIEKLKTKIFILAQRLSKIFILFFIPELVISLIIF